MGAQQEDERESVVPEWEHSARWRAFDLLVGGERVEAARVLNDNPDKAEDIRAMLDDEQWAELWEGLRELERRKYGTNEAYKSLSTKQKRAVDQVQNAALLKGSAEGSLVQAWIRKAKETMSGLSEKEGNELGAAIPSEAEKVFESVKSGIESGRSQDQSQDEDQGQDQGRSRGGWGRGR